LWQNVVHYQLTAAYSCSFPAASDAAMFVGSTHYTVYCIIGHSYLRACQRHQLHRESLAQ